MFLKRTPSPVQKEAFGRIIRSARKRYDLTQEKLADLMDCSVRWMIQVEAGKSNLNSLDTIRLMAILDLEPEEIAKEVGIHVSVLTGRK